MMGALNAVTVDALCVKWLISTEASCCYELLPPKLINIVLLFIYYCKCCHINTSLTLALNILQLLSL